MELYNNLLDGQQMLRIFTTDKSDSQHHWHNESELLFVLSGQATIYLSTEEIILNEEDLYLINHNELHNINLDKEKESQILTLQFSKNSLKNIGIDLREIRFDLDSTKQNNFNINEINEIRTLLANIINASINKVEPVQLIITKYFYDLMFILFDKFSVKEKPKNIELIGGDELLIEILKYLNDNYAKQGLTLKEVAEEFHFTPQYISSYFTKHMGVQFKKYLSSIRLNKSLKALRQTNSNVLDIAIENGFSDAKSYYKTFQETLNMSPGDYRKKFAEKNRTVLVDEMNDVGSSASYSKLFDYINDDKRNSLLYTETDYEIDVNKKIGPFQRTWGNVIALGHLSLVLKLDFKEKLIEMQKDINFKYISFYGIFDKQIQIYNEDKSGEVFYNFNIIDYIFDTFLEIGLKPFIQLSFMPEQLASRSIENFIFESNISKPKDYSKWAELIRVFTEHIIERYGYEEVQSWYFSIWYKPDLADYAWADSDEDFFKLVSTTYNTIKNIDNRLKVGGFGSFIGNKIWLDKLCVYAKENNIVFDFASFLLTTMDISRYNVMLDALDRKIDDDSDKWQIQLADMNKVIKEGMVLGDEESIFENALYSIDVLEKYGIFKDEYWAIEFNSSSFGEDLTHDTMFMAPFILKNSIKLKSVVNGLGYWNMVDNLDVLRHATPLFHGGFGMMTNNGLKKPSYIAYELLNKVKGVVVFEKDGLLVTKDNESIQILAYKYCHFNEIYSRFDISQISDKIRYNVFVEKQREHLNIELKGLAGKYLFEQYILNRDNGSIFDAWVKIGAPEMLTKEAYHHLKIKSEPKYVTWVEQVEVPIKLKLELEDHEVQLITIKLLNNEISSSLRKSKPLQQ